MTNEKASTHALNFLSPYVQVVDRYQYVSDLDLHLLPYFNDTDELRRHLSLIPRGEILIMHQGLTGSDMGDYIQDKSAITTADVAGRRIISGHYHRRQTIVLPDSGQWDYIGNPYTLSFGEANDPEKGYQILMADGSLHFVPTNLRRHIKLNARWPAPLALPSTAPFDLLSITIQGDRSDVATLTRGDIAKAFGIRGDFKLVLEYDADVVTAPIQDPTARPASPGDLLDILIDSLSNTDIVGKARLKQLWRDLD